ncbi:unnamed protein product [Linum tenue]|uniref:Reverse transcriptase zinc-binding domain-containing protein n=1 Tax=Linum tenue TaxID=586396 RepID=A0AAV0HFK3_9ROSI|nr:unnamed protein product [Linum tenue]
MKSINHSSLWRGIRKAFPLMQQATVWSIRDSRTTDFWNHHWIDHETVLGEHCLRALTKEEQSMTVAEMVDDKGEWDWRHLKSLLPNDILCCIEGMETPARDLGEDTTIWGLERDGRFRFKSAYLLASNETGNDPELGWKELWKWKGPSRVKHFLWLVLHNRLLTNYERATRNMTSDTNCKACDGEIETTEHILRHCRKTEGVRRFLKIDHQPHDLRNFNQWMMDNIREENGGVQIWHCLLADLEAEKRRGDGWKKIL